MSYLVKFELPDAAKFAFEREINATFNAAYHRTEEARLLDKVLSRIKVSDVLEYPKLNSEIKFHRNRIKEDFIDDNEDS